MEGKIDAARASKRKKGARSERRRINAVEAKLRNWNQRKAAPRVSLLATIIAGQFPPIENGFMISWEAINESMVREIEKRIVDSSYA